MLGIFSERPRTRAPSAYVSFVTRVTQAWSGTRQKREWIRTSILSSAASRQHKVEYPLIFSITPARVVLDNTKSVHQALRANPRICIALIIVLSWTPSLNQVGPRQWNIHIKWYNVTITNIYEFHPRLIIISRSGIALNFDQFLWL